MHETYAEESNKRARVTEQQIVSLLTTIII